MRCSPGSFGPVGKCICGEAYTVENIPVENRANLPPDVFEPMRQALRTHSTMERALAWFFAQSPPLSPEDLIPQDEFSYDLLVPYPTGLFLSYATS
jgi:hypothetical protein